MRKRRVELAQPRRAARRADIAACDKERGGRVATAATATSVAAAEGLCECVKSVEL